MFNLIDLTLNKQQRSKNAASCREKGIILPTYEQMKDPTKIPDKYKNELKNVGLWDIHPRNLFRISWKNEPVAKGGGFGKANYVVLPPELTGCKARIIALVGKYFPTGAHKVGASYSCLAPRLITGQFDVDKEKVVWPSTGNYCRGGAYVAALLSCESIAILPEGMSKERFEWLKKVAGEIIATPGCESNVKEIFDKCWELRNTRTNIQIYNQFEEFGNPLWHYEVTGSVAEEILAEETKAGRTFRGAILSSGSAGTLGMAYRLKEKFPGSKLAVAEALQCSTLLDNGFGDHRIEGIGDKHVPWIHDVKNTDMVIAVDDEVPVRMLRLFNEKKGQESLKKYGISDDLANKLNLLGISGMGNVTAAIKFAKYYELTEKDVVITICTDSMELYGSRLEELRQERGEYKEANAERDMQMIQDIGRDSMQELSYYDKKRVHNLKYYTWVEQQQRDVKELNAQWYDWNNYWTQIPTLGKKVDELIKEFNAEIGL
ncbi:MAG: pyridoxal-phosphate dependent enzyme [Oligoflexia bacterium]|nr:pyridoxal-phosphate dependent enzyme [Oligoflexia bacterium]MBF0366505.1 pyridoxal-phosphate dependent enzyme [Oligoflexia bacterium]